MAKKKRRSKRKRKAHKRSAAARRAKVNARPERAELNAPEIDSTESRAVLASIASTASTASTEAPTAPAEEVDGKTTNEDLVEKVSATVVLAEPLACERTAPPQPSGRGGIRRGATLALPFLGLLALHLDARSEGIFASDLSLQDTLAITALFAGVPSIVAFAGLGRNLCRRPPSRLLALHGALLGVPAGLGLGILAAVPLGASNTFQGPLLLGGAALLGALTGLALGMWSRWTH